MSVETPSFFAQVIQDHLELKRKNAALEPEMPLSRYMSEDPFDNHPLFKTEEQARVEETMSGQDSIVDEPSPLAWPTDDTFVEEPAPGTVAADEQEEDESEEDSGLWSRSRDFDWGD